MIPAAPQTFYRIGPDTDTITQRYAVNPSYDQSAPNAQNKLDYDRFPDFEPVFSDLYIETDTPTDLIYNYSAIAGHGLIMSGRTKRIMEEIKAPNIRFYPLHLRLYHEGGGVKMNDAPYLSAEYYYMQIIRPPVEDWIDYQRSTFVYINLKDETRSPIILEDKTDLAPFFRIPSYPHSLDITQLHLYPPTPDHVAIFHLWPLKLRKTYDLIISATLTAKLEAADISGYLLFPLTNDELIVSFPPPAPAPHSTAPPYPS